MNMIKYQIIIIILCTISIVAQNKFAIKDVQVPDSIRKYLISYIDADPEKDLVIFTNLIDFRNFKFVDGIYIYGIMAPDHDTKIFIKEKDSIRVFVGEDIDSVLIEFIAFRKSLSLSNEKSVKYLKAICKYLNDYFVRDENDLYELFIR